MQMPPFDGASVLACASHLKVRSKNPKNFEHWFCQRLMGKILNVLIKQHQRGCWRYLSLLAQSVGTRFLAYAQFHQKILQKLLFTF